MDILQDQISRLAPQLTDENITSFDSETQVRKLQVLAQLYEDKGMVEEHKDTLLRLIRLSKVYAKENPQFMLGMMWEAYCKMAKYSFHHYLLAMEWNRPLEKKFYQPRMRILREHGIIQDLQDLHDGVIDGYFLSMPPRVGKSTLGLLYMSWLMGLYPEKNILGGGYSTGLVKSFYVGVLEFLESDEYCYKKIFPDTYVSTSAEYLMIDLTGQEHRRYKSATFRSIDGTVTGATEANELLYLDDLCSGIEEAMNMARLEKLYQKVSVDLYQRRVHNQRLNKTCPILGIGTIWSLHDPLSRLKQQYKNNPKWRFRNVPALNDNDESNFDYDCGVGFTTNYYREQREIMDNVSFQCVYQQKPIEREGLLFPEEDMRKYFMLPEREPDEIACVTDVAFGGGDYVSMPICHRYGEDWYLVDVTLTKDSKEKSQPKIVQKIIKNKVPWCEFEANNGGDFYASDIDRMLRDQGYRCNITSKRASQTAKKTRIIQFAPDIKKIYFKDRSLLRSEPEYNEFLNQLFSYNQTGDVPNDDVPDSLAQLCSKIGKPLFGRITTINRKDLGL